MQIVSPIELKHVTDHFASFCKMLRLYKKPQVRDTKRLTDYNKEHLTMNNNPAATAKKGGFIQQTGGAKVQARGECCGQTDSNVTLVSNPTPGTVSGCGCEPGKPMATVINDQGITVSACCGKPVSADKKSIACCG
jgi:hypothetical protein